MTSRLGPGKSLTFFLQCSLSRYNGKRSNKIFFREFMVIPKTGNISNCQTNRMSSRQKKQEDNLSDKQENSSFREA
jgi:hypothetical protein